MRIALVSYEFAGLRGGGIGTYVAEAGKALTAAGHEVWLVTAAPDRGDREGARQQPGFHRVLFVEDATTPRYEVNFALARRALRFAQLAHDVLVQSRQRFDYIEFADYGAWGAVSVPEQRLFGTFGDAVVAVALHSPTYECWQWNEALHVLPPSEREVLVLEDETIVQAAVRWTPSTTLRDMLAERLRQPTDFATVLRLPMALPPSLPPLLPTKTRLQDLDFLFFGRIEPRKGVRTLVDAFARMPELRIDCIGRDGNTAPLQTSEVEFLQKRGATNVRFQPPMPRDAMLRRLQQADVVVLPSTWDNWPNTCLEAMAAGKVVLGGRNGGMAEMIEHGRSGFLIDGSDPVDLVRVLREEVGNALPQLAAIGAAAATRIRELSDPARYAAAIEALVQQHRGRGQRPLATGQGSRVSIVIPFYKEDAAVLGEAVDSAIGQTHRDLEILLVNDGSPRPDANAILQAVQARDPRIQVLHKPNGGLASARNFAIERATGDFVLCLDGDNRARPDYAATGLAVFHRCPEAMAIAPRLLTRDERLEAPGTVIQGLPFDRPLAIFRNSLGDAGAMFRRSVFAEHGLRYDALVDVYSDWALWLDMAGRGLRVQIVPRVLYDYRMRSGSLMDEQAFDRHLALLGLMIERHLPKGADEAAVLTNLAQGWGLGALMAALGRRPEYWEAPVSAARRLRHDAMRYRLADAVGKVADRLPPVRAAAHWLLAGLFRLHGRWKDFRRGDRAV